MKMTKCWTVASHTKSESDQSSSWKEPEIGKTIYGKFVELPPIFIDEDKATLYADTRETMTGNKHCVVEMQLVYT